MAMPASGCVGIITCPNNVACTSIAQAVNGNVTPPKCLSILNATAGKAGSMTNFYSFVPTSKSVNMLSLTCTGNGTQTARATSCLCVNPAMSCCEFYCPTFTWCLFSDLDYGVSAIFCVSRGTTCIACCNIPADGSFAHSGSFSTCVASGETINIMTCARVGPGNLGYANESWVCLSSMSVGGCSNIIKGVTRTIQTSATCGAIA